VPRPGAQVRDILMMLLLTEASRLEQAIQQSRFEVEHC